MPKSNKNMPKSSKNRQRKPTLNDNSWELRASNWIKDEEEEEKKTRPFSATANFCHGVLWILSNK